MIIDNRCDYKKFRIGTDATSLNRGYFFIRKIATPTVAQFKGFSEAIPQSTGGLVQHGYLNATISWVNADPNTVFIVKSLVDTALAGTQQLYLTIPYNDGSTRARRFIDIVGRPHPIDTSEGGVQGNWGIFFDTLELFINNVTIVNNPAVF